MQILKRVGQFIVAWVLAALVTTALGALFQTQRLIGQLNAIDAQITLAERLSMAGYDLFRFGSLYAPFVFTGLLVAFLVGVIVYRVARFGRPVIFAVAGGAAMIVMLFAMKEAFFGVHLVGGARDGMGQALQAVAGVLGGLFFAWRFRPKTRIAATAAA